jgi:hypothetical protein
MIIKGADRGVLNDVLTIVALAETRGIRLRGGAWRKLTGELESDWLAELDCFWAAERLAAGHAPNRLWNPFSQAGLSVKAFLRARTRRADLARSIHLRSAPPPPVRSRRTEVAKALLAGLAPNNLYRLEARPFLDHTTYEGQDGFWGPLSPESVLTGSRPALVVGAPQQRRIGPGTYRPYLRLAALVDETILAEVAPNRLDELIGDGFLPLDGQ